MWPKLRLIYLATQVRYLPLNKWSNFQGLTGVQNPHRRQRGLWAVPHQQKTYNDQGAQPALTQSG